MLLFRIKKNCVVVGTRQEKGEGERGKKDLEYSLKDKRGKGEGRLPRSTGSKNSASTPSVPSAHNRWPGSPPRAYREGYTLLSHY